MKTYNTYQEAKIANPDKEILKARDDWEGCDGYAGKFIANKPDDNGGEPYIGKGCFEICNPADYCMTVKQFLEDGHKFEVGDIYMFGDGFVNVVKRPENKKAMGDSSRYILKAKALEETNKITTETPEEKEALDAIEQVEWKNGDECLYAGGNFSFIGMLCVPTLKGTADCMIQHEDGAPIMAKVSELSKPETPEAKKEREEFIELIKTKFNNDKRFIDRAMAEALFDAGCRFKLVEGE